MTQPSSLPPSKVPSGNNTPLIIVALLLFLVMGGLVFWKLSAAPPPAPTVASAAPAPTQTRPVTMDAPPPPPEDEPPAPSASAAKPSAPGGRVGGGCGSGCSGTEAGAMRGQISAMGGAARGCYERALRNNSQLQGRIVVGLSIDSSGTICGASVTSDSMGDGSVAQCVLSMFRGKKVAAPTGGCVQASVPLNFQPKTK
ncbi:MAG: AgmX/PglI C-terminal domain-containing protein [Polyangiaceae bacterium]|nr:AgmX/PglI C-terminal domain-containing protein [Polyangiaceae bacterium]